MMELFKTNIFHMQAISGANGLEPVKESTQVSLDELRRGYGTRYCLFC